MSQAEFQTFEYAAKLVGGEEELALRLGVTRPEVDRWISGEAQPPLGVFLKAIDIVTDAAMARIGPL